MPRTRKPKKNTTSPESKAHPQKNTNSKPRGNPTHLKRIKQRSMTPKQLKQRLVSLDHSSVWGSLQTDPLQLVTHKASAPLLHALNPWSTQLLTDRFCQAIRESYRGEEYHFVTLLDHQQCVPLEDLDSLHRLKPNGELTGPAVKYLKLMTGRFSRRTRKTKGGRRVTTGRDIQGILALDYALYTNVELYDRRPLWPQVFHLSDPKQGPVRPRLVLMPHLHGVLLDPVPRSARDHINQGSEGMIPLFGQGKMRVDREPMSMLPTRLEYLFKIPSGTYRGRSEQPSDQQIALAEALGKSVPEARLRSRWSPKTTQRHDQALLDLLGHLNRLNLMRVVGRGPVSDHLRSCREALRTERKNFHRSLERDDSPEARRFDRITKKIRKGRR
ncbi:MAG: hypothetical protein Alpg2KO_13770 [Alphaproteobacteria bacterium]